MIYLKIENPDNHVWQDTHKQVSITSWFHVSHACELVMFDDITYTFTYYFVKGFINDTVNT